MFKDPKRAAGELLCDAVEDVLGLRGPTALAKATGRSKAWWSLLRSGGGARLPDAFELEELLAPASITPETAERLLQAHAEACLIWNGFDPKLLSLPSSLLSTSITDLGKTQEAARYLFLTGNNGNARCVYRLVKELLQLKGEETLDVEALRVLACCLEGECSASAELGDADAAVAAGERAVEIRRRLGCRLDLGYSTHNFGVACFRVRRCEEALRHLETARRIYVGLGDAGEATRARRDAANVRLSQGRLEEARREYHAIAEVTVRLEPRYHYPTLIQLAEVYAALKDGAKARHWLNQADRFAQRRARELADHLWRRHVQAKREELERKVAALERLTAPAPPP